MAITARSKVKYFQEAHFQDHSIKLKQAIVYIP